MSILNRIFSLFAPLLEPEKTPSHVGPCLFNHNNTNSDIAYARNITRYYDLVGQQKLKHTKILLNFVIQPVGYTKQPKMI